MDLAPRPVETFTEDKQSWRGSSKGTTTMRPITLDGAALAAVFADGHVPSGVFLKLVGGKYVPAIGDGTDAALVEYVLGAPVRVKRFDSSGGSTTVDVQGPGQWEGVIRRSKVPANSRYHVGYETGALMKFMKFVP